MHYPVVSFLVFVIRIYLLQEMPKFLKPFKNSKRKYQSILLSVDVLGCSGNASFIGIGQSSNYQE